MLVSKGVNRKKILRAVYATIEKTLVNRPEFINMMSHARKVINGKMKKADFEKFYNKNISKVESPYDMATKSLFFKDFLLTYQIFSDAPQRIKTGVSNFIRKRLSHEFKNIVKSKSA